MYAVAFSPDGSLLTTGRRIWKIAAPAIGDPERVWLSVQLRTGQTIDDGVVRMLRPEEWLSQSERLRELGGDGMSRPENDVKELSPSK